MSGDEFGLDSKALLVRSGEFEGDTEVTDFSVTVVHFN